MNFLNFILALVPIIWLVIAMMVLKWATWKAALGSAVIAAIEALLIWHTPVQTVALSALEGICMALWPIVLVIVAAVFTYNLVCRSGGMDVIKRLLTSLSSDKRVVVLLVAWCFGGFMEGMAGFGTAIAIPAGMLAAMGFPPLFSCLVCLIANGIPTPWGSIGIPTVTLANVVGFENSISLSTMQSIQSALFMILCPILIVMVTGKGFRALKGMWGITLASGISMVIPMIAVSYFVGAELVMVIASVCSLLVTGFMAKKMKPNPEYEMELPETSGKLSMKEIMVACAPFLFIFVFLLGTSKLVPPINTFLAQFTSSIVFVEGQAPVNFAWINTPGIWIFLSAILGALVQKVPASVFFDVFKATLKQMSGSIYVMLSVLAAAKIMIYSGMIAEIAAFIIAVTGSFYPFFAPWLGCIGTFVTGSGTSSSVLFGQVQLNAAQSLGMDPYWIVGLNSLGVGAGKMMSPQSLSIALSAVDKQGEDSKLLKMVLPYGLGYLALMSIVAIVGSMLIG